MWSASTAASARQRCSRPSSGWPGWRPGGSRRSRTPAGRARSKAATSICAPRNTWRRTRAASSTTASGWSAAAAGRRPITSGRSGSAVRRGSAACAAVSDGAGSEAARVAPRPRGAWSRAGREVAHGARAGARRVRGQPRAAAAARPPSRHADRAARQLRIRGIDLVNIPDGPRASGRMSALATARADPAGRHRDHPPLRLPRPEPARDAVGSARGAVDGDPQPADRDRRSAGDRRLPGCHRGLRRRLHRPHQRGRAAQPRARHRRPADWPADRLPHRRRGQPGRAQPRRKRCAASATRSRRAPSSPSPSRCSRWQTLGRFLERTADVRIPLLAGIMPLGSLRQAEFMANEVPGVNVPERVLDRMRQADAAGRPPPRAWPSRGRLSPASGRWSRGSRSRRPPGPSTRPST